MAEAIEYRLVKSGDKSGWRPLWQVYLEFYGCDLTDDITELTWNRFLDESEPIFCIVAHRSEHIAGFATITFHRSTWSKHDYCYLEDLFVNPADRQQGIARKLIEHVCVMAKERHAERLYWVTQESNQAARRLYDKVASDAGFVQYRMPLTS